ncbi:MAG: EpsG family protein [Cetobacterium sp.]
MYRYFIIIYIFTILFIFSKHTKKYQNMLEKILIMILIILSGIRYSTGTDYFNYLDYYNKIQQGIKLKNVEIGYVWLNKIIQALNLQYNFILLVCSMIYIYLIYMKIREQDKNFRWLSIFLFLSNFNMYFYSLSIVRQSVAIGIFIYSIKYIINKNLKKYCLLIILGSFFHKSIIILLPIYFLYKIKNKLFFKLGMLVIFIAIIFFDFFIKSKIILNVGDIFINNFSYYLSKFENNKISYPGIMIRSLYLLILYFVSNILKKEKEKIIFKLYVISIFLKLMTAFGYGLAVYRIVPYFDIFTIFIIPILINKISIKNIFKKIIICMLIFYNSIYFVRIYNNWNNMGEEYIKTNKTFKIIYEK